MKRTFGYTLVEALVAIGLIGVIAALAIPSLVNEYNKQVYAKTLKVAISDLETAMTTMMMNEGVTSLGETEAWKATMNTDGSFGLSNESSPEVIKNFASHLNKVLPISTNTEGRSYKALNSDHIFDYSHGTSFLTKKNVEYAISTTGYRTDYEIDEKELIASGEAVNQSVAATLLIDVNGEKSPNVLGRDSFMYFISHEGVIFPYYHESSWTFEEVKKSCVENGGVGCSEYLRRNNYKMDY